MVSLCCSTAIAASPASASAEPSAISASSQPAASEPASTTATAAKQQRMHVYVFGFR
jgi:hypothetical protein